jgi:uncharacterized membrane protein
LISDAIRFFRDELWVVFTAALPVAESRVSIPLAHSLGMGAFKAYALSVVGNMLPVPIILALLWHFETQLLRLPIVGRALEWLVRRTEPRTDQIQRYGPIGLMLFVAIPLPSTGAWTASLAAFILRMKGRYAIPPIFLGVLIAGIIVTVLTKGISSLIPYL